MLLYTGYVPHILMKTFSKGPNSNNKENLTCLSDLEYMVEILMMTKILPKEVDYSSEKRWIFLLRQFLPKMAIQGNIEKHNVVDEVAGDDDVQFYSYCLIPANIEDNRLWLTIRRNDSELLLIFYTSIHYFNYW